jgi:hypothetical protein
MTREEKWKVAERLLNKARHDLKEIDTILTEVEEAMKYNPMLMNINKKPTKDLLH